MCCPLQAAPVGAESSEPRQCHADAADQAENQKHFPCRQAEAHLCNASCQHARAVLAIVHADGVLHVPRAVWVRQQLHRACVVQGQQVRCRQWVTTPLRWLSGCVLLQTSECPINCVKRTIRSDDCQRRTFRTGHSARIVSGHVVTGLAAEPGRRIIQAHHSHPHRVSGRRSTHANSESEAL